MKRLILVILVLTSFSAFADEEIVDDNTIVCNNCSQMAMQFRAQDLGNGDYYFFDLIKRNLTHLRVRGIVTPLVVGGKMPLASPLSGGGKVTTISITPAEQLLFNATQNFYGANGSSLSISLSGSLNIPLSSVTSSSRLKTTTSNYLMSAPAASTITAFDVVSNTQARDAVTSSLMNNWKGDLFGTLTMQVRTSLVDLVNASIISGLRSPATITSRVVFPDKSTVMLQYNLITQKQDFIEGSAKDAFGNPIPQTADAAAGLPSASQRDYNYPGTPDGLIQGGSEVENLNRLGIELHFPTGVLINSGYCIACVHIENRTHCQIFSKP